jgi:hypothetical protein
MSNGTDLQEIQAEINRLVATPQSNRDLLVKLGESDGALFATPTDKRKRGLGFLRNAIDRVKTTICSNKFARANGEDVSMQRKALAIAALLDFLGTKGAATASVLIIQIGLENVCAGSWEQHVG